MENHEDDLIASIVDWDKFDAKKGLPERINGVSREMLEDEVELWNKQLSLLDPLDYKKVKEEIESWEIGIPHRNLLNFDNIATTYTRLISYKYRISYLLAVAKAWDDTCKSAIDFIGDLAPGAYPGVAAVKKANASAIMQPFVHLRNKTSSLLNYLDKMHSSIVFCAAQLDLLLKERQSQAKVNHKLGHTGELRLNDAPDEKTEESDGTYIDGDEIYEPVKKVKK